LIRLTCQGHQYLDARALGCNESFRFFKTRLIDIGDADTLTASSCKQDSSSSANTFGYEISASFPCMCGVIYLNQRQ
jgi:hypothetical protein